MATTQRNLETLLHLAQVRSIGLTYDKAREKIKLGEGPTATYDTEIKEILGKAITGDSGYFDDYAPDRTSAFVRDYIRLDENKPENSPGHKALKEFEEHRDSAISSYIKHSNRKFKELLAEMGDADKSEKTAILYSAVGAYVSELAQSLDKSVVKDLVENGSDEEKEVLDIMLRDSEFYKDLSKNKGRAAEETGKRLGVRASLVNISDAYANKYSGLQKNLDMRLVGKYFTTENNQLNASKVNRFFGNSPYAIAEMAKTLPEQ